VAPAARALHLPAWETEAGGTAVSLPLPADAGTDVAVGRLLARAAEDEIRHQRGLAYDVDVDGLPVDGTISEVAVYADNDPEHAAQVISLLLDIVDRFTAHGPSTEDLEADRAEALEALSDPRCAADVVRTAAGDLLLGQQPQTPAQRYEDTRRRTTDDVRDAVRAAASHLVALVPGETSPERAGFHHLPPSSHPAPTGRELRPRLFSGLPRSARLVWGDAGVALRLPEGDVVALWEDIVGVTVSADGTHLLQTGDGPAVPVLPAFKGAQDVVRQARSRLPDSLFVDDPDDADDRAS
jgi:hypothetical protein